MSLEKHNPRFRQVVACLVPLLLCFSAPSRAGDIFVDEQNSGVGNDGSTWAKAFIDLQSALDVVTTGDVIKVAKGTYIPSKKGPGFPSDTWSDRTFHLPVQLTLEGGYPTGGGTRDIPNNLTTLSGMITANQNTWSWHVIYIKNVKETSPVVIDGFTIQESNADKTGNHDDGGGIWAGKVNLEIKNCTFTLNEADDNGGAIWIGVHDSTGSTVEITDCTFDGNEADNGGAIYVVGEDVTGADIDITIVDTTFKNNTARLGGGAILAQISQGSLPVNAKVSLECMRCTFENNEATESAGGALWLRTMDLKLDTCTFRGNQVAEENSQQQQTGGGAIFCYRNVRGSDGEDSDAALITDCEFIDNRAPRGGAMYILDGTLMVIELSEFVGNEAYAVTDGGAGAICVNGRSNPDEPEVRICKSEFYMNTAADKGGGVYGHKRAHIWMVNCVLAGNSAKEEGGGACSNSAITTFEMHNCLVIGNVTDDPSGSLDDGGGHFNRGLSTSKLVHCTFAKNYAGSQYGGVGNRDEDSNLDVHNCVFWKNDDGDGGTNVLDEQIAFEDGTVEDVQNSVVEGCSGGCFDGGTTNTDADPTFLFDDGAGGTTFTISFDSYDSTTGQSKLTFTETVSNDEHNGRFLVVPDGNLEFGTRIVDTINNGILNDEFIVWGDWSLLGDSVVTAELWDFHLDTGSSAIDQGKDTLVPITDECDIDGDGTLDEDLPEDFFGNAREQGDAPDAGVHEKE